ncbi:CPBP family intramembrane glutamic endopeptidase [Texcoconibacillus texcoconensis]|uniref:CAAX prenyl protease 2/Lysostaphin resistance protein A-like domain-containing protein n=1 Tax=Texcoconibacillus texcoconensis TaxID=1095777 RepID=A0A840QNK4_9BACI|nr:CPBP family intramembrane glutamic endopeptidase [Texcoconibacillus texcoconensis]MBB5172930.1 hypothetical protein [Texcoconibacillus texcoconensis]
MRKQADLVRHLSDKELLLNIYFTQFLIVIVATIASFLFTGHMFGFIEMPSWSFDMTVVFGFFFGIVVVVIELILVRFLPRSWFDDGGVNVRVFQNRSVTQIFLLSLVVAFCEELLFRGVLQEQFGLVVASLIFAVIHVRYLAKPFLFIFTIVLSFSLGLFYIVTDSLFAVIAAHFTIDFLLGLAIRFGVLKNR